MAHIAIVVGSLSLGGGAEKAAVSLANSLQKEGAKPLLLTFYDWPQKYEHFCEHYLLNENMYEQKNLVAKIFCAIRRVFGIRHFCNSYKIDAVVSFEEANFYCLLAKIMFCLPCKIFASVQINIQHLKWPLRFVSKILYSHAEKIVCVSKAVENVINDCLGITHTITVYNPLDDNINEKASKELPASFKWLYERKPLFVSIGRLTRQKGQWHLVRAFTEVRKKFPTATLVILGEGGLRNELQLLIESCDMTDSVFLVGNHPNIYPFLRAADVFVFSSLFEGFGNVLLEALATDIPIVTPDCIGGPREIIAPDLQVTSSITYPYETQFGVLTKPLQQEFIWEQPNQIPLQLEERQLAKGMIDCLNKNIDPSAREPHLNKFTSETIMQKWRQLLFDKQ